jgi:type I site-specific restriction-modification system R (restriction) subunit
MVSQTNEQALENCIERSLIQAARYEPDRTFAIDRAKFWRFLETTQPTELAKLQDRPNWQRLILERLDRKIKKDGILSILKKGLAIDSAHLTLLYSQPYNQNNPKIAANFEQNIFSITRQVHYSEKDPGLSIDLVIFLNGLAIATLELKNPWTQQTVYHAKKQYKTDRDPHEPLLQFARCIVHLAVDTDEVWMTTKLDKNNTYFLPLNQGHNYGKGNPPNPQGHKTAYLWEDLLTRSSLTNIIEHFAIIPIDSKKPPVPLPQRSLFFPRYHQLDVVRQLLSHAKTNGVGHTYLIQHSAGSGKSNSITWTAYQLIELFAPGSDLPMFDSVAVVTDRRILDKQIRDNIKDFSEMKKIVAPAASSAELKTALEAGKRIIITTIQKFPFIVDGIDNLSNSRFAIIIDEAHSSQSGQASDKMNMALGNDDEEPEDIQDKILQAMEGRKLGKNASYVDGIKYTEDIINGFPSKDIPDKFKEDSYKILVVANKFLTGFDEPLLHTMYVDKKLQSVLAVQTLSRLNRSNDKMGKADTFILDFFNSVEDIRQAFEPFYTATSLSQATDVNVLHDLKEDLDGLAVYEQPEVEQFNELFFSNADADQLSPLIDLAADRFNTELDLDDIPKIPMPEAIEAMNPNKTPLMKSLLPSTIAFSPAGMPPQKSNGSNSSTSLGTSSSTPTSRANSSVIKMNKIAALP